MGQAVMEHGLHSIVVFIVLYFVMTMAGQSKEKACTRSAVLTALVFIYMVAFGHNLPSQASLNPDLKF
tara:strand:+ start:13 stop:216 length:204 start_codon:yes stop_codon:yes gene_type:complete